MITKFFFLLMTLAATAFGQAAGEFKTSLPTFPETGAPASTEGLDPQVQKILDSFFDLLQQDHVDQAYDQLTKGTKLADKPEDIRLLKSKTNQAINVYGDIVGREVVAIQNVGTHLLRATCLSVGKNYPLRWRFYFYRDDKTWRLIDIRVDDRLVDMFDEKAASSGADEK